MHRRINYYKFQVYHKYFEIKGVKSYQDLIIIITYFSSIKQFEKKNLNLY